MTWDFKQNRAEARDEAARRMANACLEQFFAHAPDFDPDWSPSDVPYQHDIDVTAFSEVYKIEHKHRPRKDWGDELLEDVSNDQTGRAGWTWSCSSVDYVLYTYAATGRWTIWPGPALELAWKASRDLWISKYGIKPAHNPCYDTLNVPVPTAVLKEALIAHSGPLCIHGCGRNVGRFSVTCSACGERSCCAVSDDEWSCARCAEPF